MPASDQAPWLKKPLRVLFPKRWKSVYGGILAIVGLAAWAPNISEMMAAVSGATRPDIEFVTITPSPDAAGKYEIVVRNRTDLPVVLTGIEVQTIEARPSAATASGNAMLPVQESFDLQLSSKDGESVIVEREPSQLRPKEVERMQIRFSAVSTSREAWVDFKLRLSLRSGDKTVAQSEPIQVRVFPRVR